VSESTNQSQLRVGIVGVGPVGLALAAHLADAGAFVVACDIDRERINAIKSSGIRLEHKIEKQASVAETCYDVAGLREHDLDLVVVAAKAFSLRKIASHLAEVLSDRTFIMCAQNGLDNEYEMASLVGEDRTLRMVVNYAGGMSSPNTVHMIFFNAPNYVAALTTKGESMAKRVAELLSSAELRTEIPDNIQVCTWEKAILNAALAPVCAITRLTMKQVMETPEAVELVKAIIDESVQVAEAEGIRYDEGFGEFCLSYLKKGGDHRPSMAVDLDSGIATEIDYINGRIAALGRKHNLLTPFNQSITAMVHMLEQSSGIK
jgi:2-dehydropantoate 2-reductase